MSDSREKIGLIAGGGQFPLLIAEAAKKQGMRVIAVAHQGETETSLSEKVDDIIWVKLGQLGRLIQGFKRRGVTKTLMAGTITKKRMFENVRPDFRSIQIMTRLAVFHDDDILSAVAAELAGEGIDIVSSTIYLPGLLAPQGCLTRKKPSKRQKEDIRFGWRVAKELGRLDIGQCVVVRRRTILALEAIEGTDETIRRGGTLAREKAVVVKVSKPHQDLRFDVPSVGPETIRVMSEVKASLLAVEAGKTLLFDKGEMIALANETGMTIVSLQGEPEEILKK